MDTTKNKFTRSNVEQTVESVYQFIVRYLRENSYPPSVREICNGVGIKSTSTIHAHLKRLQDQGRIEYTPGKRRAIMVPEFQNDSEDITRLPLLGAVTAGVPILAEQNIERTLPFSSDFLSSGEHFVLKVRGDSMIDAHIMDGDYVIVKRQPTARLGQIIVALIGEEATVKTLSELDGLPYLIPQNDAYDPIPFCTEECHILGIVTGLFRNGI